MLEVPRTVKTDMSERLLQEARQVAPGGVQGDGRWYEPFPLFVKRAQGSRIWDVDGNEYLDYHASHGPAVLGYTCGKGKAAKGAGHERRRRHGEQRRSMARRW